MAKSFRNFQLNSPKSTWSNTYLDSNETLVDQSTIYGKVKILANIINPDLCLSVRISPNGSHIALALANGKIHLLNTSKRNLLYKLNYDSKPSSNYSTTSVRFRYGFQENSNIIIGTFTNGKCKTYDFITGNCIHKFQEPSGILTSEYSPMSDKFVIATEDGILNVYDDSIQKLIISYKSGILEKGDFQRIYSIGFHPKNENEFITGGWDNVIRYYDIRIPTLQRKSYGPHICGEGVSFSPSGQEFCTASWQKGDSLQIWDYRTTRLLKSLGSEFSDSKKYWKPRLTSQLNYSCHYFDENRIVVGGTLDPAVTLLDRSTGDVIAAITDLKKSVYSVHSIGAELFAFIVDKTMALVRVGN